MKSTLDTFAAKGKNVSKRDNSGHTLLILPVRYNPEIYKDFVRVFEYPEVMLILKINTKKQPNIILNGRNL